MLRFINFLKSPSTLRYSSVICDLHHFYTRNLFIGAFILSFTKQLFGDVIICCCSKYPSDLINTNCLINSTFTEDGKYHYYYQWISTVLLLEALAFCIPNIIWKTFAGYFVESLSIQSYKFDRDYCDTILNKPKDNHKDFLRLHFCIDIIYIINDISQIQLLHMLLNKSKNPLPKNIFPIYTKCQLSVFESSDVSIYQFMCLLPHKVFFIIAVWFHILILVHSLTFIYQIYLLFKRSKFDLFLFSVIKFNIRGLNIIYIKTRLEHD